ncbi:hypothetical protein DMENIID0001_091630 [Sergentomyia squamirostris]
MNFNRIFVIVFAVILQVKLASMSSWWFSYAFAGSWSYAPITNNHQVQFSNPSLPQQLHQTSSQSPVVSPGLYDPYNSQWIYRQPPQPVGNWPGSQLQGPIPQSQPQKPFLFANSMAMANVG